MLQALVPAFLNGSSVTQPCDKLVSGSPHPEELVAERVGDDVPAFIAEELPMNMQRRTQFHALTGYPVP